MLPLAPSLTRLLLDHTSQVVSPFAPIVDPTSSKQYIISLRIMTAGPAPLSLLADIAIVGYLVHLILPGQWLYILNTKVDPVVAVEASIFQL